MAELDSRLLKKIEEWKSSPLLFVTECIQAKPSDQQAEALALFPKTKRMSIRSGHGCHAINTPIHMYPAGLKLVQDIKVGEEIMGDDGTPRKVLELYSGREMMYRIKYHDGTYYDVNESHKLCIVCTGSKSEFNSGDKLEISVRDYLKMIKDRPSLKGRFAGYKVSIDYEDVPLALPAYIMGLWLGDGTHTKAELTNIDKEVIGMWQLYAQANGLEMTEYEAGTKLYRLRRGDILRKLNLPNPFMTALEHYNLIGNKRIPPEYIFNSKEKRLQLLAGIIDTDGWADHGKGTSLRYEITQKRQDIAEDIVFIAQSCGIHATIKRVEKSWTWKNEKKWNTYYLVRLTRNTEQIPVQIKRKQSQVGLDVKKQREKLHFGFDVIPLKEDTYYGFEVDKNHLYVLGDFTVTRNTGKDAFASWIILWFMATRPMGKVACTAPTARQLGDILWSELSKWLRQSAIADHFVLQKDKMYNKENPKEWWARAISPSVKASKEEQAETLAGLHADHLLIVCDEASGITDPTFIPLEGALTQEDNRVLLIGNPTKNSGYFHDTQFHPEIKKDWTTLHWDSRKSSNVTPEMCEYFERKYGVTSNVFRVRVEGNPPLEDETVLIPLSWSEACVGNEISVAEDEPLYLGVDVARYGDDFSIILPRKGLQIMPWESFQGMNTISLGGFILNNYQEMDASGAAVDEIGVGAGVTDWLYKQRLPNLFGVNVANQSSDLTKYNRLRDELWLRVREKCMKGVYSFPVVKKPGEIISMGQELANELSIPTYSFNAHGGFVVESKKDLRSRGKASPNIADALCLTEYFYNISTQLFKKKDGKKESEKRWDRWRQKSGSKDKRSEAWMYT